jgi:hypothetical protein
MQGRIENEIRALPRLFWAPGWSGFRIGHGQTCTGRGTGFCMIDKAELVRLPGGS